MMSFEGKIRQKQSLKLGSGGVGVMNYRVQVQVCQSSWYVLLAVYRKGINI